MNSIVKRNNVTIIGNGEQSIVLAHGFGCDQSMWQYIIPLFPEQYRLILFDYVGSGRSDISAYHSDKYSTLEGYAGDVLDVMDELHLEKIIFIGHSVSSMIGMLAAIRQPQRFSKLIMIGPSPCYLNDGEYGGGFDASDIQDLLAMMEMNFTGWASYMAPLAMDQSSNSTLTQQLEHSFVSTNPRVAREFAEVTFYSDYREQVGQLDVPALIIQCSNDSIVPIEVGQYLHEQMKLSQLKIIETKGHYPHISHPIETVTAIKEYLSQNN